MAKANRNARQGRPAPAVQGKAGGLFLGLVIGLALGIAVAAALAWYFTSRPSQFKAVEQAPVALPPSAPVPLAPPLPAAPQPSVPPPAPTAPAPAGKPKPAVQPDEKYTFFDILPGDKPSKPVDAKLPREVWWLQVAALREAKDADRLKAKIALLGLDVQVQKVDSGGNTLHRVRVGPFKTEDDALGALDTLAVNNYEPRLFKEPVAQP